MRNQLIFLTVGAAILNGIFSPMLLFVFLLRWAWYPNFFPGVTEVVVALASLILSTLTLMVAGVPAALYERFRSSGETTAESAAIWLVAAIVLTLPAVPNILRAAGLGG